ncbi:CNPV141 HAL3-like domain protein [Canarypox virus]|uniref:SWPV2-ORF136 n=2 Tax=Canarypox virus TaxID=44088 RepID=A0A1V0QGA1_CNPV|nr:CNPV141 HAL3-like domain protein [Canarypox virus]ARE67364.1 SWPV2-ORF136 [Shearwaterpox virus]QRM15774.1 hal3-like domain protein [Penguinpox virus 2]QRM16106.1 hal3-like domain protein [Albatrosspox virus]AAR83487.1 CNPV141 HAL3-like domain protein [Canarypox virus]AWD84617.1 HAL3-like domain protein [Canarypox virus]
MSSYKILIGVTGSVAAIKLKDLIKQLLSLGGIEIRIVATKNAIHFIDQKEIGIPIYTDKDEWNTWNKIHDPVLHIELRRWADMMLIAPLTANSLAKIANGICNNLLTCIVRAWNINKPLLFCPAMNTLMWEHPITEQHIETLKHMGYIEVECIEKKLACGDIGKGAMAEVTDIARVVRDITNKH